jgi:hypothetical protein
MLIHGSKTLECAPSPCLLIAVPSPLIITGLASGSVAAATTAGALVAFGIRLQTPARAFNVIAGHVVGARADGVWGFVAGVTPWGVIVHAVVLLGWGFLFAALVHLTRLRPVAAALLVSVVALAATWLAAWSTGRGLATEVPLGDILVQHLLLAIALVVGMRLAPASTATPVTM